ncbi:DNA-binding response regulator [Pseudomonas sp. PB120]|uniref:response regulator n=1 Tax=Pseudomonas sp. PB120 TaxID=2494700 RepID=UPI0012FD0BA9|nr:response regulator [Pseudomonas sp. PB120]MVV48945.1 DNA-binding response regulator [Pseudomonas sp. PB120]
MIKILIVDDNIKRTQLICKEIETRGLSRVSVTVCDSADAARLELHALYDLMILDVLLPKKSDGVPQAIHSLKLLEDIYNPNKRYLKPNLTIGLTAELKDIGEYKEKFEHRFAVVIPASMNSIDWLTKIMVCVDSVLGQEQKIISSSTDKLLITIHGIRTYGKWQQTLKEAINKYSREFEPVEMKYGFFDLISFSIPYLRDRKADKIARRLIGVLNKNPEKSIYIVAHSYGTYILSRALSMNEFDGKIRRIILCGSPLQHGANIDHIVNKSDVTINECGTSDCVLIVARSLLIGMGDAGRVGFSRENGRDFINRYHPGGHSLYFVESEHPTFYEKYWVPLLTTDAEPIHSDCRENFVGEDLLDLTVKILSLIKPVVYFAPLCFGLFYFLKL